MEQNEAYDFGAGVPTQQPTGDSSGIQEVVSTCFQGNITNHCTTTTFQLLDLSPTTTATATATANGVTGLDHGPGHKGMALVAASAISTVNGGGVQRKKRNGSRQKRRSFLPFPAFTSYAHVPLPFPARVRPLPLPFYFYFLNFFLILCMYYFAGKKKK